MYMSDSEVGKLKLLRLLRLPSRLASLGLSGSRLPNTGRTQAERKRLPNTSRVCRDAFAERNAERNAAFGEHSAVNQAEPRSPAAKVGTC